MTAPARPAPALGRPRSVRGRLLAGLVLLAACGGRPSAPRPGGRAGSGPAHAVSCPGLESFGAVGDGRTDVGRAWQAAVAAQRGVKQQCLTIGAGTFLFASAPARVALPRGGSLTLRGAGSLATVLRFVGEGLVITLPERSSSVQLSGLTFATDQLGAATAVRITRVAAEEDPASSAPSSLRDLVFRGSDGPVRSRFWSRAVLVEEVSNLTFDGLSIYGPAQSGAAGPGWTTLGQGVVLAAGLQPGGDPLNYGVVYDFIACTFQHVGQGIVYGKDVQGVTVTGANFTGGAYGIYAPAGSAPLTLDQLAVGDSQFNVWTAGILDEAGITNLLVHDNSFLLPSARATGVQLLAAGFSVHDNSFESLVGPAHTNGIVVSGVMLPTMGGSIRGNWFNVLQTGYYLQAPARNVVAFGNVFAPGTVANRAVDLGQGNAVGDLSTCTGPPSAGFAVRGGVVTRC